MKKCFRSAKRIYTLCLSKKSKILSLAYLKADDSTLLLNRDIHMYDKCMTKQKENRVVDIYNAVSVRSEADSNRCIRFCRPLPSHSAIRPFYILTETLIPSLCITLISLHLLPPVLPPAPPASSSALSSQPIRCRPQAIPVSRVQIYKVFSIPQNFSPSLRDFHEEMCRDRPKLTTFTFWK